MEKRKFPYSRGFCSNGQSFFIRKPYLQKNPDGDDRKKWNLNRQVFKRASSGSSLIGIAVMLIMMGILLVTLILYNVRMASYDVQTAADSLSDGVAVFMANEGGTYEEACEKMQEILSLIESETGITLSDAALDEEALEQNEARITVKSNREISVTTSRATVIPYSITKTAVTKFRRRSVMSDVYGADSDIDYVQWAIDVANDDSHGYCLHDCYQGMGHPDYDCSSLVSFALMEYGYISSVFYTASEYSALTGAGFTCIPYSEAALLPGDILFRPPMTLEDGSSLSGHTEIYVGNGWIVGAHQSEDDSQGNLYGQPGDQTGNEISVSLNLGKHWTRIFRKQTVR